ncbi:MAG: hypothetical protein IT454_02300 [Planctomycetes bacterium]|nr:hypothetical protein [Planctomycetota bacterium]
MIRTPLATTLAVALVASSLNSLRADTNPQVEQLKWPDALYPGSFSRVDSAVLFDQASEESAPVLLVLAGTDLVMVRSPMGKPEHELVATGVKDFVVLPRSTVNGTSRVVVTKSTGAQISIVSDPGDPDAPPTIAFVPLALGSGWNSALNLCAAAGANGSCVFAGRLGNSIVRAQLDSQGVVTAQTGLVVSAGTVASLALAEIDSRSSGVELAYTTTSKNVVVVAQSGVQRFSYVHAYPLVNLSRIPGGGNGVDSLGLIAKWDYGGGVLGEIFTEITADSSTNPSTYALSPAIFGGPATCGSIDYVRIGTDSQTDFAMASASTAEVLVLHGLPQAPGYPFVPLVAPDLNSVWTGPLGIVGTPLVAAEDFDGDGDADLAMIGSTGDERGLWFERAAPVVEERITFPGPEEAGVSLPSNVVGSTEVILTASIDVPLPASWTPNAQYVDKVRMKVWVQNDIDSAVSTSVAIPTQRYVLTSGHFTVTDLVIPTPGPLGGEAAILHFEFLPLRVVASTGVLVDQGTPTYAATAASGNLYEEFMCRYPDEFNPSTLVCDQHNGGPIILGINRRRVIRPTSIESQQQPQ